MTPPETTETPQSVSARDSAIRRIVAEIDAGLRHGYFDYALTCEVIGHGRRRLVLRAGKNYQFVLPAEECEYKTNRLRRNSLTVEAHDDYK